MELIRQYVLAMSDFQDAPEDLRFCDRFLEVAEEFRVVKWELSKEFAELFDCQSLSCFGNCQQIASRVPDLRYFEGYVSGGDVITDHSWLVDEVGEVVEPTLVLHDGLVEIAEGYMGVEIPMDYVGRLSRKDLMECGRVEQAFADGLW